jgi:hypothetical protein
MAGTRDDLDDHDDLDYLDAFDAPLASAPESPPPPAGMEGFFAVPGAPAPEAPPAGEAGPGAPPGGRFVPPATKVVRREAESNKLAGLGLVFGVTAMGIALAAHFLILPIAACAIGAVALGFMGLRHSFSTGAPGRWFGMTACGLGIAAVIVMFAHAAAAGRQQGEQFGNLFGGLEAMGLSAELSSADLGGTGTSTLTLDGAELELELSSCGLHDPVPGLDLAGYGYEYEPRQFDVAFARRNIGEPRDDVVVSLGLATYVLSGSELFSIDGNTLTVSGEFKEIGSATRVDGTLAVSCSH